MSIKEAGMKKLLSLTILCTLLCSAPAFSSQPEDALSPQYDDSVYLVLRLEDTSSLLKWIFSRDNLNLFMPLILKGKSELEIMAASEFLSAMALMTPLRSMAVVTGMSKRDIASMTPLLQAAFKVSPEVSDTVKKIANGQAEAIDVATLFIGSRIAAAFAETMIKVEREKDNIFRVNNDIFMAASDDVVIFGSSINNVRLSLKALSDPKSRLFTNKPLRFREKDYAFLHVDYETASELDDEGELDDLDARKYFDKPLEIELAFQRLKNKFLMSAALNFSTALKKEYADKIAKDLALVKGGNIDLDSTGSSASPLLAVGGYLDFAAMKEQEILKPMIDRTLRNLRVRFGISESEAADLFTGAFSAVVNGTVTFESFRLPAVYISKTGQEGAAGKVFDRLTKSPHFSKVQDGILQLDSSLSPISCLAADKGETLGLYFAELASLSDKPSVKPALSDLMERESISSLWLDFAEMQNWLNDEANGVFAAIGPLMTFGGYGQYFKALREILSAELSVPSVSLWAESPEVFRTEFAVKDINADNGLFAKIIKLYQELKTPPKK